jgi:hypothetical protein
METTVLADGGHETTVQGRPADQSAWRSSVRLPEGSGAGPPHCRDSEDAPECQTQGAVVLRSRCRCRCGGDGRGIATQVHRRDRNESCAGVFARAEAAGAISLFNEADALFGKRADMTKCDRAPSFTPSLAKRMRAWSATIPGKRFDGKKPPGLAGRFLAFRNIFSFNKAVSDYKSGSSSLRATLEIYACRLFWAPRR